MTVRDIARIANVSPATVSLVLNNKKGVSEKKRQEILALLQMHGYQLPQKSSLPQKNLLFFKYSTHGMVVNENAGFVAAIIDSIETQCRSFGYQLSIVVCDTFPENLFSIVDFSSYDGVFFLGTELEPSHFFLLEQIPVPYVVIDNIVPNFSCNAITIDNEDMTHTIICHLSSLNYKSIGYFRSSLPLQNFNERARGLRESAKSLALSFDQSNHIFDVTPSMLGAYHDMLKILESGVSLPRCAFADNDTIALGVIKALKEFHYQIPEDIAIAGFDDIHYAAINSPPLTTMHVHKHLIGRLAVQMLQNALTDPHFKNIKTRVGGPLMIRKSTDKNA